MRRIVFDADGLCSAAENTTPHLALPTMKLPAWIDRVRQNVAVKLFLDSASRWSTHRASSKGAALALYMVFSLAPILMLVIAVAGFFFGDEAVRSQLVLEMRSLTGQQGAEVIQTVLASAQRSDNGLIAALISAGLLVFSATTAFNELKESLDELWDVEPGKKAGAWSLVRTRVVSFGLILVLALFLLMSLVVDAGIAALQNYWGAMWTGSAYAVTGRVLSNVFSFGVVVTLFAVVFKMLPSTRIAWPDVIPGALVTAALFIVGKVFIGMYLGQGSIASSYGAAGSVIALILWIYYSAQIFFFGAAFTRQYALTFGSKQDEAQSHPPDQRTPPGQWHA